MDPDCGKTGHPPAFFKWTQQDTTDFIKVLKNSEGTSGFFKPARFLKAAKARESPIYIERLHLLLPGCDPIPAVEHSVRGTRGKSAIAAPSVFKVFEPNMIYSFLSHIQENETSNLSVNVVGAIFYHLTIVAPSRAKSIRNLRLHPFYNILTTPGEYEFYPLIIFNTKMDRHTIEILRPDIVALIRFYIIFLRNPKFAESIGVNDHLFLNPRTGKQYLEYELGYIRKRFIERFLEFHSVPHEETEMITSFLNREARGENSASKLIERPNENIVGHEISGREHSDSVVHYMTAAASLQLCISDRIKIAERFLSLAPQSCQLIFYRTLLSFCNYDQCSKIREAFFDEPVENKMRMNPLPSVQGIMFMLNQIE
jgi:hypothetical protein